MWNKISSSSNQISSARSSRTHSTHAQPQLNADHAPRVSQRTNKGVALRRFSPTTNAVLIVFTFYLFELAAGQDLILLQSYGAVAEKCGQVVIDKGPAFFSMVLLLHIPREEAHMTQCLPDMHQDRFLNSTVSCELLRGWQKIMKLVTPDTLQLRGKQR